MKRILPWVICLLAGRLVCAQAADALSEAAALAAQKEADERYKRLAADVQALLESQEVIQRRQEDLRQRLDKLADEFRRLREDQNRSTGNYATREELRTYAEKLKEVDDKREADKKIILESIKELAKIPVAPPAGNKSTSRPAAGRSAETTEEPPYLYSVKKNDRLLDIIAGYNDHFQKNGQAKITLDQVLKANPGLKPNRLIVGHKIRIPVPPKESR